MNKNIIAVIVVVIVVAGAGFFLLGSKTSKVSLDESVPSQKVPPFDGKNTTFTIEGREVTLINGVSEASLASDSATKTTVRYFGNEARGDLNGDGKEDIAFLVSEDAGGTGLFYYVVAALTTNMGYTVTNSFFVGDRIAPQTTEINQDAKELRVNFVERNLGEPMTAQPSVGVTLYLKATPDGVLEKVVQ